VLFRSVSSAGQTPIVIRTINITPSTPLSTTITGGVASLTTGRIVNSNFGLTIVTGYAPALHLGWGDQAVSSDYSEVGYTPTYATGYFAQVIEPYEIIPAGSVPGDICGEVITPNQTDTLVSGEIPDILSGVIISSPGFYTASILGDTPVASAGAVLYPGFHQTTIGYTTPTHAVVTVQAVVITDVSSLGVSIGSNPVIASAGAEVTPTSRDITTAGKYPEVVYTSVFSERIYFDVNVASFYAMTAELTTKYETTFDLTTTLGSSAVQLTPKVSTQVGVTQALSVPTSVTANMPLTTEI